MRVFEDDDAPTLSDDQHLVGGGGELEVERRDEEVLDEVVGAGAHLQLLGQLPQLGVLLTVEALLHQVGLAPEPTRLELGEGIDLLRAQRVQAPELVGEHPDDFLVVPHLVDGLVQVAEVDVRHPGGEFREQTVRLRIRIGHPSSLRKGP